MVLPALDDAPGAVVFDKGAGDADEVQAGVLEKIGVFGGHKGVDDLARHLVQGQDQPVFPGESSDEAPVAGIEIRDCGRPVVAQDIHRRQAFGKMLIPHHQAADRHQKQAEEQQGQSVPEFLPARRPVRRPDDQAAGWFVGAFVILSVAYRLFYTPGPDQSKLP